MIGRLPRATRGGVGIVFAFALPLLLAAATFAVDFGAATLEARRLQGIADAAALDAAADPANANARAQASIAAASWGRPLSSTVTVGGYQAAAAVAPAQRFTAGGGSDAVRVTLSSTAPSYFAWIFGRSAFQITRTGTAARERLAAFSIGSRLAGLQGGMLNSYLGALTGSNLSLSVMDYQRLAGADVDLLAMLGALRTRADLGAVSYDAVLDANVAAPQVLQAVGDALGAGGDTGSAALLRTLAAAAPAQTVSLASLIDLGNYGAQANGPAALARVDALSLVTALLQLASPNRQVSFDMVAPANGLASARVTLAVGQRPANSPWLTVTDTGEPVIHTAQARLYVDAQLSPTLLPGLSGLLSVRLPIYAELASADARLAAIDCSSVAGRAVTIEARPGLGQAAIASVDPTRLGDFSTPVPLASARLVAAPLVTVDGSAQIDLGAAEPWQSLRFTQAMIDAGTRQTVSSSNAVTGLAASLASRLQLRATLLGLPIPVSPLVSAVAGQVLAVAPAVDTLLDGLTGALGVHYGQADVRVTGMRCGAAALVQ